MKKSLPIFISTLTIFTSVAGVASNASSMETAIGRTWWTMSELQDTMAELEKAGQEACPDGDYTCRKTFYKQEIAADKKKDAANTLAGMNFFISEVDPSEQRIQFLFEGRPRFQYRRGDDWQKYMAKVYIGWLDEENWEKVGGQYEAILAAFQNMEKGSEMHPLYTGDLDNGGVLAPDEFLDLNVGDEFYKINSRIYYMIEYTNGEGVWGAFDFCDRRDMSKLDLNEKYEVVFADSSQFGLWKKAKEIVEEKIEDENVNIEEESDAEDEAVEEENKADEEKGETIKEDGMGAVELMEVTENIIIDNAEKEKGATILTPDTGMPKKS